MTEETKQEDLQAALNSSRHTETSDEDEAADQVPDWQKSVVIQSAVKTPKAMTAQEAEATRRASILQTMQLEGGLGLDHANFDGY